MESSAADAVRFSTATQDGHRYLMLRYRTTLPGSVKRQRRDWVFLFESSAERDPLLARTQVEIVRTLLANAEHDDTFTILTAGTQVHAFASPLRATPQNVAAAVAFLEKAHLLGALDLDAGLTAAAKLLNHSEHPVLVHLGCGQAVLGERRADVLAGRIPRQACYVGVGVGKRGASEFMRRAAELCQGYVSEINPDEPVAWRAFDLFATLNTPRLMEVRVAGIDGKTRFLCPTSTVAQGEELCAITRLPADALLPSSVCVTGTLDGRPFREVLGVDSPRPGAAYLPRTWARLEIDRLLAEDAVKNKDAIIALSKAMYVMTPYTSLLVLENEAMYAQFKVDRGRKDHWAMYPCPAKIPVVYQPPPLPGGLEQYLTPAGVARALEQGYVILPAGNIYVHDTMPQINNNATIDQRANPSVPPPYTFQLEVPPITRAAISVESEAQLKERIRRESRRPAHIYAQSDLERNRAFEDVVVPGVVDPTHAVGIPDAPLGVPRNNVPPPPGSGGLPRPKTPTNPLRGYDTFAADNLNPEWAEQRLAALLADPEQAKRSSLWRHGARLAEQRKQYDVALRRLRRALELEKNRAGDLLSLRRDFDWFLSLSEQRVRELIAQHRSVPRELLDGVMAIADQWRAVDGMDVEPCDRAGSILRLAGARDLAWSYVTSPAVLQRGSAADWLELALRQHGQEDYDLAERAFVVAASLEPSNAEIIWERALNHRAVGRRDAARTLLRQLDKGTWAEKYREFQLRARHALDEEHN
jgi:hypothetical protein